MRFRCTRNPQWPVRSLKIKVWLKGSWVGLQSPMIFLQSVAEQGLYLPSYQHFVAQNTRLSLTFHLSSHFIRRYERVFCERSDLLTLYAVKRQERTQQMLINCLHFSSFATLFVTLRVTVNTCTMYESLDKIGIGIEHSMKQYSHSQRKRISKRANSQSTYIQRGKT